MKEDFLQFIWKMQLFQPIQLRTIYNEKIAVLQPGLENRNEGPDFLNASVQIEDQHWVGHVEIHLKSSDWYVHLHQLDSNYNPTILHVVWEYDVPVYSPGKVEIPAVQLKEFVSPQLIQQYQALFQKKRKWVYCEGLIDEIELVKKEHWLERLYFERLNQKVDVFRELLKESKNDWEEVLFWSLAKSFGLKINGANFLDIARSIPFKTIRLIRDSELQLEALLCGQAGLLLEDEVDDVYYQKLYKEYNFLKRKFKLQTPLKRHVHFFRLRPANFPTIRLSQFAQLYFKNDSLFRKLIDAKTLDHMYGIFEISTSKFWETHFTFQKESSKETKKKLSRDFIHLVVINTILPLSFLYERERNADVGTVMLDIIQEIKREENHIVSNFQSIGIQARNALHSQALIQLKTHYCDRGKCLHCVFGKEILKA